MSGNVLDGGWELLSGVSISRLAEVVGHGDIQISGEQPVRQINGEILTGSAGADDPPAGHRPQSKPRTGRLLHDPGAWFERRCLETLSEFALRRT